MKENAYSKMKIILVGNKIDLEDERTVSTEEGEAFAKANNLLFFETSAKTSNNVEKAFLSVTNSIYANLENGEYDINKESIGIKPGNSLPSYISKNLNSSNKKPSSNNGCCN